MWLRARSKVWEINKEIKVEHVTWLDDMKRNMMLLVQVRVLFDWWLPTSHYYMTSSFAYIECPLVTLWIKAPWIQNVLWIRMEMCMPWCLVVLELALCESAHMRNDWFSECEFCYLESFVRGLFTGNLWTTTTPTLSRTLVFVVISLQWTWIYFWNVQGIWCCLSQECAGFWSSKWLLLISPCG